MLQNHPKPHLCGPHHKQCNGQEAGNTSSSLSRTESWNDTDAIRFVNLLSYKVSLLVKEEVSDRRKNGLITSSCATGKSFNVTLTLACKQDIWKELFCPVTDKG